MLSVIQRSASRSSLAYICFSCRARNSRRHEQSRSLSAETSSAQDSLTPLLLASNGKDGGENPAAAKELASSKPALRKAAREARTVQRLGSPTARLKEVLDKQQLKPIYEFTQKAGKPEFQGKVTVNGIDITDGVFYPSKKEAKRAIAQKAFEDLSILPIETSQQITKKQRRKASNRTMLDADYTAEADSRTAKTGGRIPPRLGTAYNQLLDTGTQLARRKPRIRFMTTRLRIRRTQVTSTNGSATVSQKERGGLVAIAKSKFATFAQRKRSRLGLRGQISSSFAVHFKVIKKLRSIKEALLGEKLDETQSVEVCKKGRRRTVNFQPQNAFADNDKVKDIDVTSLDFRSLNIPQPPVPGLSFGLDRVLFNPGVYRLQDPRSRVYNFDPYLEKIIPSHEFDFAALKPYKIASEDNNLGKVAVQNGFRYYSSTSSMTSSLTHFHFLLSDWRKVNIDTLSKGFAVEANHEANFTPFPKSPVSIFLRPKGDAYAVDIDKSNDSGNELSLVGKTLEKLFTVPKEEFERYRKEGSNAIPQLSLDHEPEAFHYTGVGAVLVRSQLDGYDARLPGNGIFDIKTRAVLPVRMDKRGDLQHATSYELRTALGDFESFEREHYDLFRSTLLKYSLQVRLGRMDGIFIAYHNIVRMFGFEYMSIEDMDHALHGTRDRTHGDQELKASLSLLQQIFDRAVERFPNQPIRFHLETKERAAGSFMYIFAEPITEEEIQNLQAIGTQKSAEFEKNLIPKALGENREAKGSLVEPGADLDSEAAAAEYSRRALELVDKTANLRAEIDVGSPPQDSLEQVNSIIAKTEQFAADVQFLRWKLNGGNTQPPRGTGERNEHVVEIMVPQPIAGRVIGKAGKSIAELREESGCLISNTPVPSTNGFTCFTIVGQEQGVLQVRNQILKVSERDVPDIVHVVELDSATIQLTQYLETLTTFGKSQNLKSLELLDDIEGLMLKSLKDSTSGAVKDVAIEAKSPKQDDVANAPDNELSTLGQSGDLLAMTLTIQNKIDGSIWPGPASFTKENKEWTVQYCLEEIPMDNASIWALYESCKRRRSEAGMRDDKDIDKFLRSPFMKRIDEAAQKGATWRSAQDQLDVESNRGTVVFEEGMGNGAGKEGAGFSAQAQDVEGYMDWLYKRSTNAKSG